MDEENTLEEDETDSLASLEDITGGNHDESSIEFLDQSKIQTMNKAKSKKLKKRLSQKHSQLLDQTTISHEGAAASS